MRLDEATSLRRQQTITLSLLFVAGVVNFFDRASLSVANNTVRAELHLSATEMGWLLSAFSLAYGFSQLPLIDLMRRVGGRWALGGGLGLWSTAQLLTGLVRGLPAFLVFRVLLGVGESPFYPAGVQSLREWFPAESRARATAVMNMSQTLALAAAPPVLTLVMLRIGWRGMFEGLGAVGLVVAAAWCWLYRSREAEWRCGFGRECVEGVAAATDGLGDDAGVWWRQLYGLAVYSVDSGVSTDCAASVAGAERMGGCCAVPVWGCRDGGQRRVH